MRIPLLVSVFAAVFLLAALPPSAPAGEGETPEDDVQEQDGAPAEGASEGAAPAGDAAPEAREPDEAKLALATFGGGCFWCTEAIYERIEGVASVVSGYAGGTVKDPTYREVCTGTTGHAECVQIRFDPEKVSYLDLLKVFFATHDPTTRDRQGADVGPQYRSVVFWHDEAQKKTVEKLVKELDASRAFPDPIVTQVTKYDVFYPADEHHQQYYATNPRQGYCRVVIRPKVEKFEKAFARLLADERKADDAKADEEKEGASPPPAPAPAPEDGGSPTSGGA